MQRHLTIVSATFTWTGALLGLPSFAALLYFLYALVAMRLGSTAADTGGKSDYRSLVGLLVGGARLAGKAVNLFTTGAQWAIVALALAAGFLVLVALTLLAVGRGLNTHQGWARILGIVLASAGWLTGASGALAFRKGLAAGAFAVAAACTYILWALWRRFA